MTRNIIVDLRSSAAKSSLRCGNDGAWLATLMSDGVPVPPGFVVTNEAFSSIHPRTLSEAISAKLEQTSTDSSALWAVRASPLRKGNAHCSQTRLVVKTSEVPATVRRVWSSATVPSEVPDGSGVEPVAARVAVLVQKLIRPRAAGLCFTADSMHRENKIFVYANYGLGESIVDGAVVPDTHIVNRDTLEPIMDIIGSKTTQIRPCSCGLVEAGVAREEEKQFCLSPAEVVAIAELAKSIEAQMGEPARIEWALQGGTLYLVNARQTSQ